MEREGRPRKERKEEGKGGKVKEGKGRRGNGRNELPRLAHVISVLQRTEVLLP